ncbi:RNA polymerase sigma factor [Labrenzia sp. PHM005]|uniref:RNA polymerase sigma factor n=1 Tax=Labrenzia sp. PHM005 TaxID=2590016 RepID=UPI0011408840|nr:RNA polymerase sigma factor [Labrenzia sp. PHM005]QDG74624.1 RNA polymerase sigma factor [Labrenzia sp. PHM005]
MAAIWIAQETVDAAQGGDRQALESVLAGAQDQVHALARRILVDVEDAREATQEILILVLTKLSTFRGESAFSTWVYQIAVRYLVNAKKLRARDPGLTFEMFAADLENGLVADPPKAPDQDLLLNELRTSCTMAMLLCLTLDLRLAYVLGDIFELDHSEAATILEVTPAAFRKRLSRARSAVHAFTAQNCGLVNQSAPCSCPRRLPAAMASGRITLNDYPNSGEGADSFQAVKRRIGSVVDALKSYELFSAVPDHRCPDDIRHQLTEILSPNI